MTGKVAEAMRTVIAKKGLRQKAVAEKAGFTQQQFSDMLHGRKVVRAEYLPAIARALGVEVGVLFAGE